MSGTRLTLTLGHPDGDAEPSGGEPPTPVPPAHLICGAGSTLYFPGAAQHCRTAQGQLVRARAHPSIQRGGIPGPGEKKKGGCLPRGSEPGPDAGACAGGLPCTPTPAQVYLAGHRVLHVLQEQALLLRDELHLHGVPGQQLLQRQRQQQRVPRGRLHPTGVWGPRLAGERACGEKVSAAAQPRGRPPPRCPACWLSMWTPATAPEQAQSWPTSGSFIRAGRPLGATSSPHKPAGRESACTPPHPGPGRSSFPPGQRKRSGMFASYMQKTRSFLFSGVK